MRVALVSTTKRSLLQKAERVFRTQTVRTVMFQHAIAAKAGINLTDLSCLNLLGTEGPMSAGQLADRLGLTRGGAITALVDRLEHAGYVRRGRDAQDRRKVLVELDADRALPVVSPLLADFMHAWTDHLARYTVEQLQLIVDFTAKSNDIVHTATLELLAPDDRHHTH